MSVSFISFQAKGRFVVTWAYRMSFVVTVFLKSLLLFYMVVLNFSDLVEREKYS